MNCDRSKALIPVYVDGELSEELAGPLRRHLMECAECRASVSEAKAMASWFVPSATISVPEGFAARVVRLASSGARVAASGTSGPSVSGDDWLVPSRASHDLRHATPVPSAHGRPRSIDRTARFAMSLAAVAAAALIGLTLLLASGDGGGFDGSSIQAQPSVENALEALEELNRREAEAAAGVSATQAANAALGAEATPAAPEAQATLNETEQPKSPR